MYRYDLAAPLRIPLLDHLGHEDGDLVKPAKNTL
jgi:hypothetical protein